jgi:hypothetical protein
MKRSSGSSGTGVVATAVLWTGMTQKLVVIGCA